LEASRRKHGFNLYGWVVMPEHVHLLLWPWVASSPIPSVLSDLKRVFARAVVARWKELRAPILDHLMQADGAVRFWQRGGGHDRNIITDDEFVEKLRYIHGNPVARELVSKPSDWAWSSARWYDGDRTAPVRLSSLPPQRPE
jgi:putative transposase